MKEFTKIDELENLTRILYFVESEVENIEPRALDEVRSARIALEQCIEDERDGDTVGADVQKSPYRINIFH